MQPIWIIGLSVIMVTALLNDNRLFGSVQLDRLQLAPDLADGGAMIRIDPQCLLSLIFQPQ